MTTSEVVTRIARDFGRWPHEVWHLPLHYYLGLRRDWLRIIGLAPEDQAEEDGGTRRTVGPDITVETYGPHSDYKG